MYCSLCHRDLSREEHYRYSDGTYCCLQCHARFPQCERCGKPTTQYRKVNERTFCTSCYEKLPKCNLCNAPLIGEYYKERDNCVCTNCYTTLPHCRICNITIKEKYHTIHGKIACTYCFEHENRCDCCKELLFPGEKFELNSIPGVLFCKTCVEQAKRCDSCSRPIPEEDSWALGDGRFLCKECNEKGVFDIQTANGYFFEMRNFLLSEFGVVIDIPVKFRFVTTIVLESIPGNRSPPGTILRGLFGRRKDEEFFTIYILKGLTKNEFQAVTAHEYTHAWQTINCPQNQSLLMKEGFACWIQYQVYKKIGDKRGAEDIEKRDDPVYGEGFKKVRQLAKEKGYVGLLQYVKNNVS